MSDAATDPAHAVSKETTPTWEMELLVSGATVFGLMQLPELIDRAYFRLFNLSPQDYAGLLFPIWAYLKVATICLVFTFVAHLCLRGYWVALVGMNSVYPGGIRWEKLRTGGAIFRSVAGGAPTMAETIEQADNRATRVFATGFGFAMLMLKLSLGVMLVLGFSVMADAVLGAGHARLVFASLFLLLVLPMALASMIDRRFGQKLPPGHALQRVVARVLTAYGRVGMGPRNNPLIAMFISHEGRPKALTVLALFLVPVLAVLMAQDELVKGRLPTSLSVSFGSEDLYSGLSSPNAFYADTGRERTGRLPLPYIPGRVVSGPYLALFVPFIPRLQEGACPSAPATTPQPAFARARLDCLARLSAIRIDGIEQPVEFQASTDPESGQPGMLAMLPVRALPPGRHELSLRAPTRSARRYRIPFWK